MAGSGKQIDWTKAEREIRAKLDDWKGLLQRQVPQARQILKKLLAGPIRFTPVREDGERYYTFMAPIALDRLIAGAIGATMVASQRETNACGAAGEFTGLYAYQRDGARVDVSKS